MTLNRDNSLTNRQSTHWYKSCVRHANGTAIDTTTAQGGSDMHWSWIDLIWLITGCTLGVAAMSLAAMAKDVDQREE
jgi:hypothetical protein